MTDTKVLYTAKAEKQLKHLFNLLGIRIIPCYFMQENPEKFQQWHYNACNQTALLTAYVLAKLLSVPGKNNSNPFKLDQFNIGICEGIFTEPNCAEYNHAFVFAEQHTSDDGYTLAAGQGMGFFIDVGRITNPTVFKMGLGVSAHPEDHSEVYKLKELKNLDIHAMMYDQPEYFTGKTGIKLCTEIRFRLEILGFDLTNFDWKA